MIAIDTNTEVQTSSKEDEIMQYYAYADNQRKTWYITKHKRSPYKELILLFELGCVRTNNEIYHPDPSMPVIGSVVCDIKGERLEVRKCNWI